MGYESKVIFRAVMDVLETSKTLNEAMIRVANIANAEGIVVTLPASNKESAAARDK